MDERAGGGLPAQSGGAVHFHESDEPYDETTETVRRIKDAGLWLGQWVSVESVHPPERGEVFAGTFTPGGVPLVVHVRSEAGREVAARADELTAIADLYGSPPR